MRFADVALRLAALRLHLREVTLRGAMTEPEFTSRSANRHVSLLIAVVEEEHRVAAPSWGWPSKAAVAQACLVEKVEQLP